MRHEKAKIIAVWGSPHSGKTTFATKLATAIYDNYQATVIVLYTDLETPTLPVIFPNEKSENLGSVGIPLSKTEIDTDDVIKNLVTIKERQNFGFLGFRAGENKFTYPRYGKAKAEELYRALGMLADYVIVDCTSNLENNVLSSVAVEQADQIIRLASPDLSAISFFLSQKGVYKGGEVPEGLKLYTFPESDWAMFSAKGPLPGSLQTLNTYVWQEWYPNEGKKFMGNGNAMLEVYSAGDMQSPDYECGIWVPITAKEM